MLAVGVAGLIVSYLAGGTAGAGVYGMATVVVLCFGAWRGLRRREAPRRWRTGSITFRSRNDRLKFTRCWGTEGAPESPDGGGDAPPQNDPAVGL